jgi:protein-S-isoprenylcysteine O-methyltransferase Ste14
MKLFLKNLLFTVLVPGAVAVYVPLIITSDQDIAKDLIYRAIGTLLLLMGALIYLWTVWDFASLGKGTPLPLDAPRHLVVRGLYRIIRNPMYLGVLLVITGWAGIFASEWLLVYALGVGVVVHLFVVFYEEPKLSILFGKEYEVYCQDVGRWMPRFTRREKLSEQ